MKLYSEDLLTGERKLGTHGRFVLVAVDESGQPAPVLPLADTRESESGS